MSKHILITGGTGLIGRHLTDVLQRKGHQVAHLSRTESGENKTKTYIWDITKNFIEDGALENANIVIHLAGAGVGAGRWTAGRKKEILESRVNSTRLLSQQIKERSASVEVFLGASAVGIYGSDLSDEWRNEDSPHGQDFLAQVTVTLEAETQTIAQLGIRTVLLRIGLVLSKDGGALAKLAQPIKLGVGAALGTGKQYMSWIHIDDLCGIFEQALIDPAMSGPYNAVAPHPVTNKELTRVMAKSLNRPLLLPAVPAFGLKVLLGEMAEIVLNGSRVSNDKIIASGYHFKFPELEMALRDLLGKE